MNTHKMTSSNLRKWGILIVIPILTVIVLLSSSCFRAGCLDGNYNPVTEIRNITGFDEIINDGAFDIQLRKDTFFEVRVEAEENLIPYIVTELNANTLTVRTRENRCLDNNLPITVIITAPDIRILQLSGSGSIVFDELDAPNVKLSISGSGYIKGKTTSKYLYSKISGSGDMNLSGTVSESDMIISGSGSIKAYNLIQDTCFATISGSGDMFLNVVDLLDAKITGSGSITYKGNPYLSVYVSGSGRVLKY